MEAEHPRDVDPSITGQPHQVTGKDPDLMGNTRGRLVTGRTCQRRYRTVPPQPFSRRAPPDQAAPRWSASHTAVDSLTPSPTDRPQNAIQAAIPSGVPERYPSNAAT